MSYIFNCLPANFMTFQFNGCYLDSRELNTKAVLKGEGYYEKVAFPDQVAFYVPQAEICLPLEQGTP